MRRLVVLQARFLQERLMDQPVIMDSARMVKLNALSSLKIESGETTDKIFEDNAPPPFLVMSA